MTTEMLDQILVWLGVGLMTIVFVLSCIIYGIVSIAKMSNNCQKTEK